MKDTYYISTDSALLDVPLIHSFLSKSYWARDIPQSIVRNSIDHSLCFGVFWGAEQVGFARVVSDYSTFAYLADVFILDAHRGKGLSKKLMETVMGHPSLQGLRRWMLATADAHGLYRQFGFGSLQKPERIMEILQVNPYTITPHGS